MQIFKIILGALLILGGVRNIQDVFSLPNAGQAAGFLTVTFFFIIAGGWLLVSGIRHNQSQPKVFDSSDDESGDES